MIPRFERILLLVSVVLAGGSGLVFAWMKHLMRSSDPFSVVNHPWQPLILSLHVLAAPVLLFALGLITRDHILGRAKDPRARRGRWSGILAAGVLLPMVGSGYTLQVLVDRGARDLMGWGHLGAGALFLGLYAAHFVLARGGRQRQGSNRASAERGSTD
jgi:hypothetical protein